MLFGCTAAIAGFCLYSHVKMQQQAVARPPEIRGVPDLGAIKPLLGKAASQGASLGSSGSSGTGSSKEQQV